MGLNSKEIFKSWPKWKQEIQIGKIDAEKNPSVNCYFYGEDKKSKKRKQ